MSNQLVYGNPNRSLLKYLHTENYLDSLIRELISYPFPSNESEEAKKEIEYLIPIVENLSNETELQKRYELYDSDFENYIINVVSNSPKVSKSEVEDIVKSLHDDIVALLVKLKYHYQRIRPFTLAYYMNLPFYPFKSDSADSPSYPSGHAFQAKIYCEVLGNRYPQYYKALQALATDVSVSRMSLGLHYPSDTLFSGYVAEVVLKHPEFRKKYKL
jgi:hypothetical protein